MRRICLLLSICLAAAPAARAQPPQKWPSTLLWRITGNGLQQPSYLFGTIHVQQRQVFYFGDSVYHALEQAQGFAMEIDPQEIFQAMVETMMDMEDKKEQATGEEPPAGKRSKGLQRFRKRYTPPRSADDMNTIIDLYLYLQAQKGGKWLGGLEDANEHLSYVMDELGGNYNEAAPVKQKRVSITLDSLLAWYSRQELDKIDQGMLNDGGYGTEINTRNRKMVRMADSLAHRRSMFFAVGSAHLPGDSGMISLLRSNGYTVTPVFSSKKIAPQQPTQSISSWPEIHDADSSFSYRMPAEPSLLKKEGMVMEMKYSFDLNELVFYVMLKISSPAPPGEQEDFLISRMIKSYRKENNVTGLKKGRYMGYPSATGVVVKLGDTLGRVQMVQNGLVLYLMIASSESPAKLRSEQVNFFMNSLHLKKQKTVPEPEWAPVSDTLNLFTASCPCALKPKLSKMSDSARLIYTDICSNPHSHKQYLVSVVKMQGGYHLNSDSVYFSQYKEEVVSLARNGKVTTTPNTIEGYPAMDYEFTDETGLPCMIRAIVRSNTIYVIAVLGDDETIGSNRFFNSFRFSDIPGTNWEKRTFCGEEGYTYAPGPFQRVSSDNPNPEFADYFSYDPYSGTTYFLLRSPYNKYTWFNSDSAWIQRAKNGFETGDSAVKTSRVSGLPAIEFTRKENSLNNLRHSKVFVYNDKEYELRSYVSTQQYHSPLHRAFYDSIQFLVAKPSTVFTNKAASLLQDMASPDSATAATALEALSIVDFTKADKPLLHRALLQQYPKGPNPFTGAGYTLSNIVAENADSTTVTFIHEHYRELSDTSAVTRAHLLHILAAAKTTEATLLLKELALDKTLYSGPYQNYAYTLIDTPALAKLLFPEINRLLTDTNHLDQVLYLLDKLSDSGKIGKETIMEAEKDICTIGLDMLKKYRASKDAYIGYMDNEVSLLVKLNTPAAGNVLNQLSALKIEDLLFTIFTHLNGKGLPLSAALLQQLAASDYYRIDIYRNLKQKNREKIFPAAFANQEAMARSGLYNYITEDDEYRPEKIQLVKELTAPLAGKTYRFYFYKVLLDREEGAWYPAVSGPFPMNRKELSRSADYYGEWMNWDETFKTTEIQKQFKVYLEQLVKEN